MKHNLTKYNTAFDQHGNKSQYDISLTGIQSINIPIILTIDSRNRNLTSFPNQNKYTVYLDQSYREVVSIELVNIVLPSLVYNITKYNNKLYFEETIDSIIEIEITPGFYETISDLLAEIESELNLNSQNGSTYQTTVNPITKIIKISQIVAGTATLFNLYFFGFNEKTYNDNPIPKYKDNSIGQILGFNPANYASNSSSEIFASFPYNLNQLKYLNLYINKTSKFRHIESNNDASKGCFCVIPVNNDTSYIYNKTATFVNNSFMKVFTEPIPDLKQLDIEWRDQDNNLYDFNNQDHLLIFEIKQGAKLN
jgi:hypothetical protein